MGKRASELQSNIIIGDEDPVNTPITGTLHYVTGYVGFNGSDVSEQSGNYIALKFEHTEGATTTVEILSGKSGKVTLDDDMLWVGRIANTNQRIKAVTTLGDETVTKTYSLTGLVLETATK